MNILKNKGFLVGVVAMGLVVLISNILVAYPIGEWLTWGAFTFPLAFFVTDITTKLQGKDIARKVVLVGFIFGVILSLLLADVRIAIASGVAFLTAQMLDIAIFYKLRNALWWKAPLASSIFSSAIDTGLFFSLAFVGTGVPWITLGTGDYVAKLFMAFVLLIPFKILYNKFKIAK